MSVKEIAVTKTHDIGEGEMKSFDVEGQKVLVIRRKGHFSVFGGLCPHYGADLADGVLSDERIVCPWHHAAYEFTTGNVLEPPSLDSLPTYEWMIKGDDLIVSIPDEAPPSRVLDMVSYDPSKDARTFVILGAGAAGNAAAQTLREDGFQGRIVMITQEKHPPYDRPQLSKDYLEGSSQADALPLRSEDFYRDHGIEIMLETRVTRVDSRGKTITFANGDTLKYDALLLATGGVPRKLDVPGADLANIFTLRSMEDSTAIIRATADTWRVAVIGASFIAMETAWSLTKRGLAVHVIAPDSVPFEKTLGPELGRLFQTLHEQSGVVFKLNSGVARFEGDGKVEAVVLESGERIATDLVVVGIGVTPATFFLNGIGMLQDGSVPVDDHFRGAEGLYAAGDIATFPYHYAGEKVRIEHWVVAEQQGRIAGHNMAGKSVTYSSIPFFWTNQCDMYFRYVGYAKDWDEVIIDGDLLSKDFMVFFAKRNKVCAVAGSEREKPMAAIQELVRLGKMPLAHEVKEGLADFEALLEWQELRAAS